jgi:hypothetical protein
VASPAAVVVDALADAGGVIAFGELHQTKATAKVRSAIGRFTDDILPVVAPRAAHIIVETWMTTGACGENERRVTEEVARTTERPAATEDEIVRLLRRAKEMGVAPHVLGIGCDEYKALAGGGEGVDYDKLLTITCQHLERAIRQAALLPRSAERPLVIVYGGALHNDLYPDPTLAKYSFGPAIHTFMRGAYREVDLYAPEMIETMPALKAEGWYAVWRKIGAGKRASVIHRSPLSSVLVFGRSR